MELVIVADKSYQHYYGTALPGRGGLAPLDLNHYNFHTPTVERDAKLLRDVLDFKVSAIINDWQDGAFLRQGDEHHDVAVFSHANGPEGHASHHHTGFTVSSVDHMVNLIDRLNDSGIDIEFGIGRHFGGDNVFAYFKAPDGHRIELVAQMTELDDITPVQYVDDVEGVSPHGTAETWTYRIVAFRFRIGEVANPGSNVPVSSSTVPTRHPPVSAA